MVGMVLGGTEWEWEFGGRQGIPTPISKGVCVTILLKNKALASITYSEHPYVGSAGIWRCPHHGCFADPTDVWTLGSKP